MIEKTAARVSLYTVHRLVLTSLLVSAKFNDDFHLSNKVYAQLGGISLSELNACELHFLQKLEWKCLLNQSAYFNCAVILSNSAITMEHMQPHSKLKTCQTRVLSVSYSDVNLHQRLISEPSPEQTDSTAHQTLIAENENRHLAQNQKMTTKCPLAAATQRQPLVHLDANRQALVDKNHGSSILSQLPPKSTPAIDDLTAKLSKLQSRQARFDIQSERFRCRLFP